MNEVVNKILELENRAESLISDKKNDEKKLESELKKRIDILKKSIEKDADERIAKIVSAENEDAQNRIKQTELSGNEKKKELEEVFKKNSDAWSEKIFENIINRKGCGQ